MNALLQKVWQDQVYKFLILLAGSFGFLYYLNLFLIGLSAEGGTFYAPFLQEHFDYISGLRYVLIQTSEWVLQRFGYNTFTTDFWLRVSGHGGVIVVYSCLGYGVMSFFTAFVLAWPKSLNSKLWFLPAGLLLIQTLNIIRFIMLALFWKGSIFRGVIDHHDLFNIILYLILLSFIYFWARKTREDKG